MPHALPNELEAPVFTALFHWNPHRAARYSIHGIISVQSQRLTMCSAVRLPHSSEAEGRA